MVFCEKKLRFLLDFYPQTTLKLSSETQVVFLPFILEIIVVVFFSLLFHEILKVVDFDFFVILIAVYFDTLQFQVKHIHNPLC